jgi:hypothetical protein
VELLGVPRLRLEVVVVLWAIESESKGVFTVRAPVSLCAGAPSRAPEVPYGAVLLGNEMAAAGTTFGAKATAAALKEEAA